MMSRNIQLRLSDESLFKILKKACKSKNQTDRAYAHFNLAKVYIQKGMLLAGQKELILSLNIKPGYMPAQQTLKRIENQIQ